MTKDCDISPEKEGSFLQFLYRQLFITPSPVSPEDINLQGKTEIVTGSNGGIGLECCQQLGDLKLSELILAVRDETKGQEAAATLFKVLPSMSTEVWLLDMSSYDSIASFVERTTSLQRLDIVILNAGITRQYFQLDPTTGHEENIQVNYLSTALLALKLFPVLKSKITVQQQPSRMVIVTTDAAAWTPFPEQNSDPLLPAFDKPDRVDMLNRYYTSKLLQQFFLIELTKRVPASVAVIVATTPGFVYGTQSQRDLKGTLKGLVGRIGTRIIGYSPEVGARQLTDAAVKHGSEIHGHYLCSQKPKPLAPIIYTSKGVQISKRLWRETMADPSFTGVEQVLKELAN
ncbi:Short chain dehydrogenase sol3 [Lachnellula suecica]|uniref:Short chain dehydrogenase sol3 n=1 Tax=Lachnellula suecica TaxID=602035 RepID=A0A8T9C618_9HELO|nr:Short chain dehydrogenase sol3 [Lachnellula suecica]